MLLPAPKGRAAELLTQKYGKTIGVPVVPIHRAVLTKLQDWKTIPARLFPNNTTAQKLCEAGLRRRAQCFFATSCGRGCNIGAAYQSTTCQIPAALLSGNLDIIPDAHARVVTVGKNGKADGVLFIDKTTGQEMRVTGKTVVLAAGSGETLRILLNSNIANSSGLVGKYIMDTVGTAVAGHIPMLENLPAAQRRRRGRRPSVHTLVAVSGTESRQAQFCPRVSH